MYYKAYDVNILTQLYRGLANSARPGCNYIYTMVLT